MATTASMIIRDANIRTQNPAQPRAEAVAFDGDTIIAVGSLASVLEFRGAATEVVDAAGRTLTPGLIDGHIHPLMGAAATRGVDFGGITTMPEFLARLRTEADRILRDDPQAWLRGWNVDYGIFAGRPITAEEIEDAVHRLPTALYFFDMHTVLATSAALTQAGVTGAVHFDDVSQIVVDVDGRPTGEVREATAFDYVLAAAPVLTRSDGIAISRRVLAQLNSSGITGGCVMDGDAEAIDFLEEMAETGPGLPVRLVTALRHGPERDDDGVAEYISLRDRRGRRWRGGVIKMFLDGVIDTGTGWLSEPDTMGEGLLPFWPEPAHYAKTVERYAAAGFQIATHAIGDRAISAAIDAYLAVGVIAKNGVPHRIEHLEYLADEDLPRLAAAGITASMQPLHLQWRKADGSDSWATRLGPERTTRAWRIRDVLRSGAPLALGSDWPVAQLDARIGMAWARLRRTPGDRDGFVFEPDQCLTAQEALDGFTTWSAAAQGDGGQLGKIEVGFKADVALWGDDPVAVDADDLVDVPVHLTVVGGEPVHRHDDV
ncbi:amidohydrolase [Mycobacterium hodleri]|uniref:amidohydrolase n=1 Tax=Mycolicibacterium hodleri TaxID=49897 RepID=UPI0021F2BEE5|nr:amidohydrolase [Mycolicibacterium hodleri]MCV7136893.1 amidohydrolase [Mycolicibacterium hodleri]